MSQTLYERLGSTEGITKIVLNLVENHLSNPAVSPRFLEVDRDMLTHGATTFFIAGTGGPNVYEGKDMLETHKGMNISAEEFMGVLDDALGALAKNNIGQREQEEVLYILYSMRAEIVKQ